MDLEINDVELTVSNGSCEVIQEVKEIGLIQVPPYLTNAYGPNYLEVISGKVQLRRTEINFRR